MKITFVESPYFVVGRAGHRPEGIVIHITENDTLSGLDNWFRDNPRMVSAHYGVGRDGTVHQYVDEENVAWHARLGSNPTWRLTKPGISPSYYTIGIEHVGRGNEQWEDAKYEASATLIREICDRWDISIDRDHIIRHDQVSSTHCPGTQVDMEKLVEMARARPEREYDFVDHPGTVRTRANANLREKPTTLASVAGVILSGTQISYVGWVTNGLRVARNSYWYKNSDGNYLWAGATEEPNPDLTPVPTDVSHGKTAHPLHLRAGPGTDHTSLRVLPVGSPLEILDKQGDWLRVTFAGQEGFVHGGFVQFEGDSPAQPMRTGRTIAGLNFRTGPGTQHPSLRVLPVNTHLKILGNEGKWLNVEVDGQEGFVHQDFVDVHGRSSLSGFIRPDSLTPGGVRVRDIPLEPHVSERINSDHIVANAWNRLGGLIAVLADLLDVEPGVALAVWMVESGGRGFVSGRMVIRFENHVFYNLWGKDNQQLFDQHFRFNQSMRWQGHQWRPSIGQPMRNVHQGQKGEWQVFEFAATLNESAAKRSISMGGPQIMGFNHSRIGYETVLDMFDDFSTDERYHVLGFFNFVKGADTSSRMVRALRVRDFASFSELYNGSQATTHAQRMQENHDKFRELKPN